MKSQATHNRAHHFIKQTMFFNRKNTFFLELDQDTNNEKSLEVKDSKLPKTIKAQKRKEITTVEKEISPKSLSIVESETNKINSSNPLTTAEAIAIELRDVQATRPVISNTTFAPENLQPSGMVKRPRRTPGANLGTFKTMANGMFKG